MRAEFFDIFGLITFTFLIVVGMTILRTKKRLPDWMGYVILLIGILGLIIDGTIVIKTFIIGG